MQLRKPDGGYALVAQTVRILAATMFALLGMAFGGCRPIERKVIDGELNTAFLAKLQAAARSGAPVTLSSYGGDPEIAFAAAPIIDSYPGSVAIGRLCLSSCAEFVLPTKAHETLLEQPLIGFHGSDEIARWLASKTGEKEPICGQARADSKQRRFQNNGWNIEFWKEVAKRLRISSAHNKSAPGKCASMVMTHEISIWFPSSTQMSQLLGLKTVSKLCADKEICWRWRIHDVVGPREAFIVGDDIYYMNDSENIESLDPKSLNGRYFVP